MEVGRVVVWLWPKSSSWARHFLKILSYISHCWSLRRSMLIGVRETLWRNLSPEVITITIHTHGGTYFFDQWKTLPRAPADLLYPILLDSNYQKRKTHRLSEFKNIPPCTISTDRKGKLRRENSGMGLLVFFFLFPYIKSMGSKCPMLQKWEMISCCLQ